MYNVYTYVRMYIQTTSIRTADNRGSEGEKSVVCVPLLWYTKTACCRKNVYKDFSVIWWLNSIQFKVFQFSALGFAELPSEANEILRQFCRYPIGPLCPAQAHRPRRGAAPQYSRIASSKRAFYHRMQTAPVINTFSKSIAIIISSYFNQCLSCYYCTAVDVNY